MERDEEKCGIDGDDFNRVAQLSLRRHGLSRCSRPTVLGIMGSLSLIWVAFYLFSQ